MKTWRMAGNTVFQATPLRALAATRIELFVALLVLLFSTVLPPAPRAENAAEPTYKGKPLSYWLDEYDASLRAAGQKARGQRPDYEVPGGDMNSVYREATNTLGRLAPELYEEYVAARVPFHAGSH